MIYKQLERETERKITLSEILNLTYHSRVQYSAPKGKLLSMENGNSSVQNVDFTFDHEYPLQTGQRLKKKSMGVGWGKFYEHGVEARPCGKPGKRLSFVFCYMYLHVEFQEG